MTVASSGGGSYPAVIFVAGFLLFLVQPLLAKAILPWFGGATGVWATALVFYQTLLLAGYALAHWFTGLSPQWQARLHLGLLALSLLWLPIIPAETLRPDTADAPAIRVLLLLLATVAGPYLLLAATSPLFQSWYSEIHRGRAPYRLYAVSNAGSMAGLVAYPFLLEPLLGVRGHAFTWSILYLAYAALAGGIAWSRRHMGQKSFALSDTALNGPSARSAIRPAWFILPLIGAGLLLAVSNQITMDLAAVPFLWILPLGIYLLSYILSFAGHYNRSIYGALLGIALAGAAVIAARGPGGAILAQVGIALLALFAATMVCHGELVLTAPASRAASGAEGEEISGRPTGQITAFYLTSAAGGAAGGALVALVAPAVFPGFWELPIFLLLSYLVFLRAIYTRVRVRMTGVQRLVWWSGMAAVLWLAGSAFVLPIVRRVNESLATTRNFYGVLRVVDEEDGTTPPQRRLLHGHILHGAQFLEPERREEPTTYYAYDSGVDLALRLHPARESNRPLRIGVIGLGAGTIAALAEPADSVIFYELNPAVEAMAREYFSFLDRSQTRVVLGDGRLTLEQQMQDPGALPFDVLVVDAFSSDAIPVHLLTREAATLYREAIRPDGAIAIHITNRHLDLAPVVRGMALETGMTPLRVRRELGETAGSASTWFLLSRDQQYLRRVSSEAGGASAGGPGRSVVWTDGFSNLLQVLR